MEGRDSCLLIAGGGEWSQVEGTQSCLRWRGAVGEWSHHRDSHVEGSSLKRRGAVSGGHLQVGKVNNG